MKRKSMEILQTSKTYWWNDGVKETFQVFVSCQVSES